MECELINKFQQNVEIRCYSQATKKAYIFHIRNFLKFYYDDLKQENIIKHLFYLKTKRNYSPSALNVARASLIYFFENSLNQEITIKIPQIKREKSLPKPVDREVILKLINNVDNLKHRVLIELLYSSGLRLAEVVKIKWNDVDLLNKTVRVNNGKGNKDRISILSYEVVKHLFELRGLRIKNNNYIFFSNARITTHISKKTVGKILENASRKAGIGFVVTPHRLRHSFATHSLESGTDIRIIQSLLGHASPKTTMIYTEVTKRNLSKISNPLDVTIKENKGGIV